MVDGVDAAVTVVPLKGDINRAAPAVRSDKYPPVHFRGLQEAEGGGRARRRHKTAQLRERGRQHCRCRRLAAAAAGSGATGGRRGGGVYGGRCADR